VAIPIRSVPALPRAIHSARRFASSTSCKIRRASLKNTFPAAFNRTPRATGEAYTLAHHLTIDGEQRSLMIAALRYTDTFVKTDGTWLFAERRLYVDWLEQRAL